MDSWLKGQRKRLYEIYREVDTGYRKKRWAWIHSDQDEAKEPKMGALDKAFDHADFLILNTLELFDAANTEIRTMMIQRVREAMAAFDECVATTKRVRDRKLSDDWRKAFDDHPEWMEKTSGGGKYLKSYTDIVAVMLEMGIDYPGETSLKEHRALLQKNLSTK